MNSSFETNSNGKPAALPAWTDCDFFCIHGYAEAGSASCGWRGRTEEARRHEGDMRLYCPRCGCATLLRIPLERVKAPRG